MLYDKYRSAVEGWAVLLSTIVSHYQQAKDCEYNHQQFEIAHRQNLLLRLFRRIGRQPLPISYYEYERSNRPPFHGSASYIIAHILQLIQSLACLILHFRYLPQAPRVLQVLQLPQPLQPLQIGYRFNQAHITHHAYQLTTLTIATICSQFLNTNENSAFPCVMCR